MAMPHHSLDASTALLQLNRCLPTAASACPALAHRACPRASPGMTGSVLVSEWWLSKWANDDYSLEWGWYAMVYLAFAVATALLVIMRGVAVNLGTLEVCVCYNNHAAHPVATQHNTAHENPSGQGLPPAQLPRALRFAHHGAWAARASSARAAQD